MKKLQHCSFRLHCIVTGEQHSVYRFVNVSFPFVDDGYFTSWGSWGECSSDCESVTYKTRTCQVDDPVQCSSLTNVAIDCNSSICPGRSFYCACVN